MIRQTVVKVDGIHTHRLTECGAHLLQHSHGCTRQKTMLGNTIEDGRLYLHISVVYVENGEPNLSIVILQNRE